MTVPVALAGAAPSSDQPTRYAATGPLVRASWWRGKFALHSHSYPSERTEVETAGTESKTELLNSATGVIRVGTRCSVGDLKRVAIVPIEATDNDDHAPIYRLYALFDGKYRRGEPQAGEAGWLDRTPRVAPIV